MNPSNQFISNRRPFITKKKPRNFFGISILFLLRLKCGSFRTRRYLIRLVSRGWTLTLFETCIRQLLILAILSIPRKCQVRQFQVHSQPKFNHFFHHRCVMEPRQVTRIFSTGLCVYYSFFLVPSLRFSETRSRPVELQSSRAIVHANGTATIVII